MNKFRKPNVGNSTLITNGFHNPYSSSFVDLQRVIRLYLHCNEISNNNQLTVAGSSNLFRKYM